MKTFADARHPPSTERLEPHRTAKGDEMAGRLPSLAHRLRGSATAPRVPCPGTPPPPGGFKHPPVPDSLKGAPSTTRLKGLQPRSLNPQPQTLNLESKPQSLEPLDPLP